MSGEIEGLLDKARRSLASARRNLEDGDADFAASRAYYAMSYAAEAALLARGRVFSKHAAVVAEFGREFVRPEEVAAEHGRALREGLRARLVADYGAADEFPASRAEGVLRSAERFVEAVQTLLDRPRSRRELG